MSTRGHHSLLLGGEGTWSPAELLPAAWWNDDSPVTDAGGGLCSQWGDISGNGRHLLQATSGRQTVINPSGRNGRRTIQFDGVMTAGGDKMGRNGTSSKQLLRNVPQAWIFGVFRKTSTDASPVTRVVLRCEGGNPDSSDIRLMLGAGRGTPGGANVPAGFAQRLDPDPFAAVNYSGGSTTAWGAYLVTADYAGNLLSFYVNGSLDGTTAITGSGGNTSDTDASYGISMGGLGAFDTGNADIEVAEAIVGLTIPSAGDITKLFAYAADRWGL